MESSILPAKYKFYISPVQTLGLLTILCFLAFGCNNAKAVNLDASSSAVGVLLSDGSFGIFGNLGSGGTSTTPAATSTVSVTVSGYTGLTSAPIDLTILDNTTSATEGLQILANGSADFATALDTGDSYTITMNSYTGGQTCALTGGTGTAGSGTVTIDCERHLAVAAGWKTNAGSPVLKIFEVNHSAFAVPKTVSVTIGGSPTNMDPDLIWNGTNYLLVWKSSDTVIKGQLYNIELTAIGSAFTIYTGASVNIGRIATAYNSTGAEFAVVWTENASSSYVKHQRLQASNGTLIGSTTVIIGPSTSTNFFNADLLWDGTKYLAAFRQKTSLGANSLSTYSFTTSTATSVKTYTKTTGSDSLALDYPSLLLQGTNAWLFYGQANTDGNGNITNASVYGSKNFQVTPTLLATDTNPSGCDPSDGDQYSAPSSALNTSGILLSYDVYCGDVGGSYSDVNDVPVNITSGAAGTLNQYSTSEIGSSATLGSSIACRASTCYISAGDEYNKAIFLFDPDFTGATGGTSTIYPTDSNGVQYPQTVMQ